MHIDFDIAYRIFCNLETLNTKERCLMIDGLIALCHFILFYHCFSIRFCTSLKGFLFIYYNNEDLVIPSQLAVAKALTSENLLHVPVKLYHFPLQADLVVLLHNWFPWSHCLRNLMIRTYSLSTYDSVIYRRTTMLNRQTSFNNNSTSGVKTLKVSAVNGSVRPMRKLHRVGTEVRTNNSRIPVRKFSSIQYKHRPPSTD